MKDNWFRRSFNLDTGGATGGGGGGGGAAAPALVQAAAAAQPPAQAAQPPAQPAAAQQPAQPPAQTPAQAEAYLPQGLDAKFKGASDRETLDNIAKHFTSQPKAPDKPEGYELVLDDALTKRFGDLKDDPVLPMWRQTAHELGLSPDQFNGAFAKLYGRMAEAGLIDDPVNVQAELDKLAPTIGTPAQRQEASIKRVNAAATWVNGLTNTGAMTPQEAGELMKLAATHVGVQAIEKLAKLAGQTGIQGGGTGGGQQLSDHEKQMRSLYPSMFKG